MNFQGPLASRGAAHPIRRQATVLSPSKTTAGVDWPHLQSSAARGELRAVSLDWTGDERVSLLFLRS